MATDSPDDPRTQMLADWNTAVYDKAALLADPEARTADLTERARLANTQGLINDDDLSELLELADAAYGWAVEELSNREPDASAAT